MPIQFTQIPPEPDPNYAPVEVFTRLRNLVFQTLPEKLGLAQSAEYPVVCGARSWSWDTPKLWLP